VSVEHLDAVAVRDVVGRGTVPTPLERVGNDRETALCSDGVDGRIEWPSTFWERVDTDSQEVAVRGRYLDAGDADESVRGRSGRGAQRSLDAVVISDDHAIEPDRRGQLEDRLDRGRGVERVGGMDVTVDVERIRTVRPGHR